MVSGGINLSPGERSIMIRSVQHGLGQTDKLRDNADAPRPLFIRSGQPFPERKRSGNSDDGDHGDKSPLA